MTDIAALTDAVIAAEDAYATARDAKFVEFGVYDNRGRMGQATANAKLAAQELQRAKDALCAAIVVERKKMLQEAATQ